MCLWSVCACEVRVLVSDCQSILLMDITTMLKSDDLDKLGVTLNADFDDLAFERLYWPFLMYENANAI